MSDHKKLKKNLQLDVYFADPHSPWQRGSKDNINGMLKMWLKKGADLSPYTQEELNKIEKNINKTPRKILYFQIPKEVFTCIIKQNNNQKQDVRLLT